MNQNQWGNGSLLGPGPMMAPPFFMDGPPMPMPMGGPPLSLGPQMPGPQMPGPQLPGPQLPGPQMPGPPMPGPLMLGGTDIDTVVMEDQVYQESNDQLGNNRSTGGPRNNRVFDDNGSRKRGMPGDNPDLQDLNNRENRDGNSDRSSDRQRRRSRDRTDRSDRNREDRGGSDRSGTRRGRRSKWDNDTGPSDMPDMMGPGGMDMTGMLGPNNMMQTPPGGLGGIMYQNSMFNLQQQQMGMPNAPNMMGMGNMGSMGMANMGNMPPMPGNMQQMPGHNLMMDQNMGMMNPMMGNMNSNMPMLTPTQPIYLSTAVLLPPSPNAQTPTRRERPNGCRTIFVGGLPEGMEEESIWEIFQRFGKIANVKLNKRGYCHLRFESMDSVEGTFCLSGCRFKYHEQADSDALSIFIDYALNREDQQEYERKQKTREPTPPPVEPFTAANLAAVTKKIKSEDKFAEAAPSLVYWMERGECDKRNVNVFYSLIQASNNQVRRLFNEKMAVDEELNNLKTPLREKFLQIIAQFEQVSKIMEAAKLQRVWDHFSKQQRRNIEMWQKMTLELDNMREEFNTLFDEDDDDSKSNKKAITNEKYEALKRENEELLSQMEEYKNEAFVAKSEAERNVEKFKAQFIAQQALQSNQPYNPLLPPPPMPQIEKFNKFKLPPPPIEEKPFTGAPVSISEGRLISIITAFLLVHPVGANLECIHSYVVSIVPKVKQSTVNNVLQKYGDVFTRKSIGIGASIEHKWLFCTFDDCRAQIK